ncbi:acetate--CoA ligase family protein [Paeniroseomonas aquatica]|uniref:acetate--CoA ligase family protein n=1 Tax=Paeniroseomonas aquatica TaxID=373043 RepID=UPI003624558F
MPRFPPLESALVALRRNFPDRLVVAVMTHVDEVRLRLEAEGIPVFEDPTRAVRAVAGAERLRRLRGEAEALPPVPSLSALPALGGHEAAAKAVLAAAGLLVPPEQACATAQAAVRTAEAIGFPVVAKILSEDIPHKTEIGGVMLGLADATAVEGAFAELMRRARAARPEAQIEGVLIAPMLRGGVETIIGTLRDPVFGPMVMFGLGGVSVELFADVAFASAPLSPARAARLVDGVRGSRLLAGWRGGPALDRAALEAALCAVAALAAARPEIASIDVNPFLVQERGGFALDAVILTGDVPPGDA